MGLPKERYCLPGQEDGLGWEKGQSNIQISQWYVKPFQSLLRKSICLIFYTEVLIHTLSFLDPQTLLDVAFISRRFRSLVTSSHAWRSAFSRYFPSSIANSRSFEGHESAAFSSSQDRRYFTRLSESDGDGNLWRKEYILRTRLLRNLARGKANVPTNPTTGASHGSVVITYPAVTGPWNVSHITANFTPRGVRLLHASVHSPGVVTASDPTIGKVHFMSFLFLTVFTILVLLNSD